MNRLDQLLPVNTINMDESGREILAIISSPASELITFEVTVVDEFDKIAVDVNLPIALNQYVASFPHVGNEATPMMLMASSTHSQLQLAAYIVPVKWAHTRGLIDTHAMIRSAFRVFVKQYRKGTTAASIVDSFSNQINSNVRWGMELDARVPTPTNPHSNMESPDDQPTYH